jgi:hypothetical protein
MCVPSLTNIGSILLMIYNAQFATVIGNSCYIAPHEQLMSLLIQKLTDTFANCGGNIDDYDLPKIISTYSDACSNRLISDELDDEPLMLSMHASSLVSQLNSDKKHVYDTIIARATSDSPGFYFVCSHSGTGKTFLWNAVITRL